MKLLYLHILNCLASSLDSQMLNLVNQYRQRSGRRGLNFNSQLQKAAVFQAQHMASSRTMSHTGPTPQTAQLSSRTKMYGFTSWNVAENVAMAPGSNANQVFEMWRKSPGHNKNMLGDYTLIGIASCVGRDNNRYWAQVFGKEEGGAGGNTNQNYGNRQGYGAQPRYASNRGYSNHPYYGGYGRNRGYAPNPSYGGYGNYGNYGGYGNYAPRYGSYRGY